MFTDHNEFNLRRYMILRKIPSRAFFKILQIIIGSFENEALENEDRSTKHSNLENEAPKTRKRRP